MLLIPRERPGIKPTRTTIKNNPLKSIMKNRVKLIPFEVGILELLDNIFDNYEKNIKDSIIESNLLIEFYFLKDLEKDINQLLIRENSGGISSGDIEHLVTIGSTSGGEIQKIGTWGEAFLHSIISIGKSAYVYSYHPNGIPFYLPIEEEFYSTKLSLNWCIITWIYILVSKPHQLQSGRIVLQKIIL